jgi:hypothetical protein
MLFFLIIFVLAGCSESKNSMNQPVKQKKRSVSFRHKLFQKEFEPELEKMLKVKDEIVLKSDPADSSKMFIYNKHIGAIEDSVFMMKLKYLKSKGVDILSLPIKQGDTEQGEQKQQEFYSEKKNYKIQLPIDDINKILKSLIDKYGFQVQSSDDYSVYFKGQKCDLKLQQNYFDLEMYLINPKNNNAYLCDTLIRYFKFKFEGDEKTQNSDKIVLQQEQIDDLKEYNHLLEEFFPFVLKGDFTWDNDYRLYIK